MRWLYNASPALPCLMGRLRNEKAPLMGGFANQTQRTLCDEDRGLAGMTTTVSLGFRLSGCQTAGISAQKDPGVTRVHGRSNRLIRSAVQRKGQWSPQWDRWRRLFGYGYQLFPLSSGDAGASATAPSRWPVLACHLWCEQRAKEIQRRDTGSYGNKWRQHN